MSNVPQESIERLKKLRALAEQGATEGERTAARTLYDRLVAQYGLTDADLEEEKKVLASVRTRNQHGLLVACQAYRQMFNVTGNIKLWKASKPGHYLFEVPAHAKGDFEQFAASHVKGFFAFVDHQMPTLVSGYVQANHLYPADGAVTVVNTETMSADELLRWAMRKAAASAAPVLPAPKHRQLEGK
jgi:hypothetical protein